MDAPSPQEPADSDQVHTGRTRHVLRINLALNLTRAVAVAIVVVAIGFGARLVLEPFAGEETTLDFDVQLAISLAVMATASGVAYSFRLYQQVKRKTAELEQCRSRAATLEQRALEAQSRYDELIARLDPDGVHRDSPDSGGSPAGGDS